MKKLLLSLVSAFLLFTLSAQVSENFSDYTVGGKLAQQAQAMGRNYWTTWNSQPGGAEDGTVDDMSGNKVGKWSWGNDQILLLGGKTASTWALTLKIYVPAGQCGYFNICAAFAGQQSKWAFQVYFNKDGTHPGVGTMDAGGADAASFTFTHATWIPVKLVMDLDANVGTVYINETMVHSWVYTDGTFGQAQGGCPRVIDALNIYPPTAGMSTFYVDDINFELSGDVTFPILDVTPESITKVVAPGDAAATIPISINNTGTSIGDYLAWVNFGEGTEGANINDKLTYSGEALNPLGGVGFPDLTEPTWVETAVKFPVNYFCNKIGTYIKKLAYFVPDDLGSNPIIFKIYGPQVDMTGPGELLTQATLNTYTVDAWNEVTLPEPFLLDGREIWISVHITHLVGAYPMAFDGKSTPNGITWRRYANYSWSELESSFGDFMVKGLIEGKTTPACWFTIPSDEHGSILMGATKKFNIVLNPNGLEYNKEYKANLFIETNDEDHPLFKIPVSFLINNELPSNNANLKEVTADGVVGVWNPTNQSYLISNFVTKILEVEIVATPEHDLATVTGDIGTQPIKGGVNNYGFTITAEDGVTTIDYKLQIIATIDTITPIGIAEIENIVKLYPNPVVDYLYLDIKSDITLDHAYIYDFTGKMVKQIERPTHSINLSNLPAGTYMMRVISSKGEATHKFMKQ